MWGELRANINMQARQPFDLLFILTSMILTIYTNTITPTISDSLRLHAALANQTAASLGLLPSLSCHSRLHEDRLCHMLDRRLP